MRRSLPAILRPGPMWAITRKLAQQIIERATAGDPARREVVTRAAIDSVRARIALWDGVWLSLRETEHA